MCTSIPRGVTRRSGNRIKAVRNSKYITRNIEFFKKGCNKSYDLQDKDGNLSNSDVGDAFEQDDPPGYPIRKRHRVYGHITFTCMFVL